MRLVIARYQADYTGRLIVHLPTAKRLIMLKADGSISVYADNRAYEPLNWMSVPCTLTVTEADEAAQKAGASSLWLVRSRSGDIPWITLGEVFLDVDHGFGVDPGLQKDGVEAHLQVLLAEHPAIFGEGWQVVKREFYVPIDPIDPLLRDADGMHFAAEVKRRGEIDGVEQLIRYPELMNRDPQLAPVKGIFVAQQIKPQAAAFAADRGIACQLSDYDALRGMDNSEDRLFRWCDGSRNACTPRAPSTCHATS